MMTGRMWTSNPPSLTRIGKARKPELIYLCESQSLDIEGTVAELRERLRTLAVCVYCGSKDRLLFHHIRYDPEETVACCPRCNLKIHKQVKFHQNSLSLCLNCGRHFTSNEDGLCYYCQPGHEDKHDWYGLTSRDKTPPIWKPEGLP